MKQSLSIAAGAVAAAAIALAAWYAISARLDVGETAARQAIRYQELLDKVDRLDGKLEQIDSQVRWLRHRLELADRKLEAISKHLGCGAPQPPAPGEAGN